MIKLATDVVLTVTGFQLVLLAAVLLWQHPEGGARRNLLVAFLLTKALLVSRWFAYRFGLLEVGATPFLYVVSSAAFFLLAPLLYLHVRALCYRDFRLRPATAVHFGPCLLVALAAGVGIAQETGSLDFGLILVERLVEHFWPLFWGANFVQILGYIVAMFVVVVGYRRRLTQQFSSLQTIDLGWLQGLLALISLHWLFVTCRATVALFELDGGAILPIMDLFSIVIFLVFTTVLVVKGLSLVKLFPGIEKATSNGEAQIDSVQLARDAERLERHMEEARPHLTPALTVDALADQLAMPTWQLSRVINNHFHLSFFRFVNAYRVEEAKRHLGDPDCQGETMTRILHESGFNSKSAFNEAFKRHTGMTPSEYKRRIVGSGIPSISGQPAG